MAGKSVLQERYTTEIVPALMRDLGFANRLQVPRVEKIVLNMGLGDAIQNPKLVDAAVDELSTITGQRGVVRRARKSIAQFKLRAGMRIGVSVTLRRRRMYEFMERLFTVAIPRIRDFKGVSTKAFDGAGNYTLGIREEIIFPEIDYDKLEKIKGLNVTFVTTAKDDDEARALLQHLGMPFRK